jgi:hypothetical protein
MQKQRFQHECWRVFWLRKEIQIETRSNRDRNSGRLASNPENNPAEAEVISGKTTTSVHRIRATLPRGLTVDHRGTLSIKV